MVRFGDVAIDMVGRTVRCGTQHIHVIDREMDVLVALIRATEPLGTGELAEILYGPRSGKEGCITSYVYNIRRRLTGLPGSSLRVVTIGGRYRLEGFGEPDRGEAFAEGIAPR